MPKRFTATEKWSDPWFCSLTDNEKLFWLFVLDSCDNAGIWRVNWFMFGCYVKNFKYNPEPFKGRIVVLDSEKWFIPKFVDFQYGVLNPNCAPHLSVIRSLGKHTLTKGLVKGILTLKDKDMDKAKDKDQIIGRRGLRKDKDIIIIPDWIDKEAWKDFSDMRIKIRKPMTRAAIRLTIEALEKLKAQGQDPKTVLNQSIQRSWQGVFPLSEDFKKKTNTGCVPIPGKYDGMGEKA